MWESRDRIYNWYETLTNIIDYAPLTTETNYLSSIHLWPNEMPSNNTTFSKTMPHLIESDAGDQSLIASRCWPSLLTPTSANVWPIAKHESGYA